MKIKDMANDINVALTMEDFMEALKNVSKSVSAAQLNEYQEWMDEFGA